MANRKLEAKLTKKFRLIKRKLDSKLDSKHHICQKQIHKMIHNRKSYALTKGKWGQAHRQEMDLIMAKIEHLGDKVARLEEEMDQTQLINIE